LSVSGQSDIYFIADEAIKDANYTQVLLGNRDLFISLAQLDVKGVQKRWFQLRDNALEIFLTNGKTCLLAFRSTQVCLLLMSIHQNELYCI
jgi:hypothetical protein